MARTIDVLRVATEPAYAAELTAEQWYEVAHSAEWNQMLAEQRELLEPTLAAQRNMLPGFMQQAAPPVAPQVLNGPYNVVGQ